MWRACARFCNGCGCPSRAPPLGTTRYLALMSRDKKIAAGSIRFVLLRSLGDAYVTADVAPADLAAILP